MCVLDFVKASDSINREALWFHMFKTGVSENMIKCITIMDKDIKFCVERTTYPLVHYNEKRVLSSLWLESIFVSL